jgi:plastocyanin
MLPNHLFLTECFFSMLKKILSGIGIAACVVSLNSVPFSASASNTATLTDLKAGDLVRGTSFSAVYYYGKDGMRYVFPNDKTYFTWYTDFNGVRWLSDADLGKIQIGGNVTYNPGIRMIKINSDPKVYAVGQDGTLHWVTSETLASGYYGTNWNSMIDDVPDSFFSNYTKGTDFETSDDFLSLATGTNYNIDEDKDIQSPAIIQITDNAYSQTTITIKAGHAVRFENKGTNKHTATASDLSWGTGTMENGINFTRYFNKAGTYPFFCSYHTSMTGTIIVE